MRSLGTAARLTCAAALLCTTASAQFSLTTLFASNNGLSASGATLYYDITVASPVRITALDISSYESTGSALSVDVWTCASGYQPNVGNAAAWTRVASGSGTAAGRDQPSNIALAAPFLLTPGTYGMAVEAVNGGQRYTTGNGSNQTYSDPFLTLNCGASSSSRFSGNTFTPRVWNGTIYYTPGQGLFAAFNANPTAGPAPLTVSFSDASFSSDPGGVTSWAWDFDEDGVVDSTLQNPNFTYSTPAAYDVTLTVTDAAHAPSTLTRPDFIFAVGNDECANAIPVVVGVNGPFTNRGATTSTPGWPCGGGANDVWFAFSPSCPVTVDIETCSNTSFDTTLQVFDGTCGALNSLGCNDDACGDQSRVTIQTLTGTTYYIRVGGASGARGNFELTLAVTGNGAFRKIFTGCGATDITADGSPNLGGAVTYTLSNVVGTPLIWIGAIQLNNPICAPESCRMGATFDLLFAASSFTAPVPCDPALRGQVLYVQGADLGGPNGCPLGVPIGVQMTLSDTIATTFG